MNILLDILLFVWCAAGILGWWLAVNSWKDNCGITLYDCFMVIVCIITGPMAILFSNFEIKPIYIVKPKKTAIKKKDK